MTIQEKIELILKHDPASRDSDKRLQVIFMNKMGMNLSPEQIETFYSLPALETIRRTRQQIQMDGKYPASAKVESERYKKFEAMRGGFSKPEDVLEAIEEKNVDVASYFVQAPAPAKYVPLPWNES